MSLRVWLPLNGTLENKGLDNVTVTNNGATVDNNGKIGKCYSFDGSDDYITVQDVNLPNVWSYSCWLYSEVSSRSWEVVMTCNTSGGDSDMQLGLYTRPDSNIIQNTANGQYNASISMTYGQWNHFVGTFDGSNLKTYLNGILVNTKAITNTKLDRPKLTIGARCRGSNYDCVFKGKLNDIRIYDHALSPLEVKQISQGLILHYPLNRGGFGQENFILESHKVTSGGQASGITRTYESDGSIKIVSTSGNGNYASLGFAQDSNTSVGNNMAVGDTYCISCDAKIESGTKLPTLFINGGNGYKQLKPVSGSIVIGKWIRVYYTSTWANPGTNYGNISLHLGFSDAIGTYYFKNFKLEKGSIPTPWCPNSSDALATTMGMNDNVEYDTSGYGNNGTKVGTFDYDSDTPKYNVSTKFPNNCNTWIVNIDFPQITKNLTFACWCKIQQGSNSSWSFIVSQGRDSSQSGFNLILNGTEYAVHGSFGALKSGVTVDNTWKHLVGTYDGTTVKIYINGELKNSMAYTSDLTYTYAPAFVIGKMAYNYISTSSYFPVNGLVSDVRIYATALSAEDVKSLYNNSAYIDNQGNIYGAVYEEV